MKMVVQANFAQCVFISCHQTWYTQAV